MKLHTILFLLLSLQLGSCDSKDDVKAAYYKLEISINPTLGGIVEVLNAADDSKIEKLDAITKGTKIKLRAIPNQGFSFLGFWESDILLKDENPVLNIQRDNTIKAVFRSEGGTPVEIFGALSVEGSKIVDATQVPIQLRGMSLFWSQWMGKFYNQDVVNWLAMDWEANIIRASMGVDENDGYIFNNTEKKKIETVVDAAIETGIYVIIDWHSHHAEDHTAKAVTFFTEMAKKYGKYPHVIYEIYNEPLDVSWNGTIKPYAEEVINAIRKEDPDNLILVGTPRWSQDVDAVIDNTIEGANIAYVLHFYASEADHHNRLFNKATKAIQAGIPLFVSEWGVSEASGDGNFNKTWTQDWIKFMDDNKLSWCNWSIADKTETSAALLPGANVNGGWENSELNSSGGFIRDLLRSYNGFSNPKE